MNTTRIPLCLVVGFLGSGKTTLLKSIIRQFSDKKLAFVVNEFSEIDADGAALQREHDKVVCLPGGSVFCRCLSGQFIHTLQELPSLLDLPHCDGVVVEASGIADPGVAPQMMQETGLNALYRLTRVIAVVDPGNVAQLLDELPNTRAQLAAADIILINKSDIHPAAQVNDAATLARSINDTAVIERVAYCEIALDLFSAESCSKASGNYALCADPNFAAATAHTTMPVDVDKLLRAINSLHRELYRAKGFLKSDAGAVYLDWTPSSASRFDLPDHQGPYGFSFIGRGEKTPAINAIAARLQSGAFNDEREQC